MVLLVFFFFSFYSIFLPPPNSPHLKAGSHSVALTGLELAMYIRMALNSQSRLRFFEIEELSNLL